MARKAAEMQMEEMLETPAAREQLIPYLVGQMAMVSKQVLLAKSWDETLRLQGQHKAYLDMVRYLQSASGGIVNGKRTSNSDDE